MTISQMRNAVETAYKGLKWKYKVQAMSDEQVIAVYHRFVKTDKFKTYGGKMGCLK